MNNEKVYFNVISQSVYFPNVHKTYAKADYKFQRHSSLNGIIKSIASFVISTLSLRLADVF